MGSKKISWLVYTVESKPCLREYDVVWVRLGDGCTAVTVHDSYIGKFNTLIKNLCHLNNQLTDNQIHFINSTKNTVSSQFTTGT